MQGWLQTIPTFNMSGLEQTMEQQFKLYDKYDLLKGLASFPAASAVGDYLQTSWERLELKFDQSFDSFLVVPGCPMKTAQEMLAEVLRENATQLKDPWGAQLDLNKKEPIWGFWDKPIEHRLNGEWVSAEDFYAAQPIPGYEIVILRSRDISLPRKDQGSTIADRPDITGGSTPIKYREMLADGAYSQESYTSPRGNLAYYTVSVATTQVVPDVWRDKQGTICWCPNAQFSSGRVPGSYFFADSGRIGLDRDAPSYCSDFIAPRSVVRLEKGT